MRSWLPLFRPVTSASSCGRYTHQIESESWKFFSSLLGNNYNKQRELDLSRELMDLKARPNFLAHDLRWSLNWLSDSRLRLTESRNEFLLELSM